MGIFIRKRSGDGIIGYDVRNGPGGRIIEGIIKTEVLATRAGDAPIVVLTAYLDPASSCTPSADDPKPRKRSQGSAQIHIHTTEAVDQQQIANAVAKKLRDELRAQVAR